MVAPSYARKRQELAVKIGLGRKPAAAPRPAQGQAIPDKGCGCLTAAPPLSPA